jgi:hypothetical protein
MGGKSPKVSSSVGALPLDVPDSTIERRVAEQFSAQENCD